jgi:hypothetical protein
METIRLTIPSTHKKKKTGKTDMSLDDIIELHTKKKTPQEDGFIREASRVAHIEAIGSQTSTQKTVRP